MGSCLGISAGAAYAAQLYRRAFHGLTPTAKCWRRFAAYWNPGLAPLRGLLEPRAGAASRLYWNPGLTPGG